MNDFNFAEKAKEPCVVRVSVGRNLEAFCEERMEQGQHDDDRAGDFN